MISCSPIEKIRFIATLLLLLFLSPLSSGVIYGAEKVILHRDDSIKVQPKDTIKYRINTTTSAANIPSVDSVLDRPRIFKGEELIRGERLFFGLAYLKSESVNCAGCHNTRVSDTLNWNPDALEISEKYLNKSPRDLSRILLRPMGNKLAQAHKGIHLSPEDIVLIKAYMDKFVEIGLKPNKPVITNLILFIIASIFFLFSITDLIITKIVKRRWINYLSLTITGIFIGYTLVINSLKIGRSQDYSPVQPVKFSHAVHAGQNATDCIYCHSTAPYSKTAGIPALNVCMNCHLIVRNGTRSGTFEISKIISHYENKKPLEWIKVHNLPDHVFFSHAQHVTAGKVNCSECHGNVKEMDHIRQVSDLSMGWCINCHRTKKIDFHENKFCSQYRDLAEKMKKRGTDSVTVSMIGGTECMKCHY
jgi:hypothetical protein